MSELRFEKLFGEVRSSWPSGFYRATMPDGGSKCQLRSAEDAYDIQEEVASKYYDHKYALLYQVMSWALFACVKEALETRALVMMDEISVSAVRSAFENRVMNWSETEDGHTADMAALRQYRVDNGL